MTRARNDRASRVGGLAACGAARRAGQRAPRRLALAAAAVAAVTTAALSACAVGSGEGAGPAPFVATVEYRGVRVAAGRAGGLFRLEPEGPAAIDIGLTPPQQQISALAVFRGELWLGTEAGLLRLERTSCGYYVHTVLPAPVRRLAPGPETLAVTTDTDAYVIDATLVPTRIGGGWKLAALAKP